MRYVFTNIFGLKYIFPKQDKFSYNHFAAKGRECSPIIAFRVRVNTTYFAGVWYANLSSIDKHMTEIPPGLRLSLCNGLLQFNSLLLGVRLQTEFSTRRSISVSNNQYCSVCVFCWPLRVAVWANMWFLRCLFFVLFIILAFVFLVCVILQTDHLYSVADYASEGLADGADFRCVSCYIAILGVLGVL